MHLLVLISTLGKISFIHWKFIFRGSDYKLQPPLPLSLINNKGLIISRMDVKKGFHWYIGDM